MIIKAIIVDDDLKSRELIHSFCKTYSDNKIQILDLCSSVDTAIIAVEKHKPDLVFLDIDMPEKNGFELVNHFSTIPFEIVFVTGHANQFTKAIEINSLEKDNKKDSEENKVRKAAPVAEPQVKTRKAEIPAYKIISQ